MVVFLLRFGLLMLREMKQSALLKFGSEQISPPNLDIPGIFTPNGDGFNDTWDIPGIDQYPEATIRIYNRAKRLIVEFKGSQMPWDGRDGKGNLLESGYYLYQIELRNERILISGYVTILR